MGCGCGGGGGKARTRAVPINMVRPVVTNMVVSTTSELSIKPDASVVPIAVPYLMIKHIPNDYKYGSNKILLPKGKVVKLNGELVNFIQTQPYTATWFIY